MSSIKSWESGSELELYTYLILMPPHEGFRFNSDKTNRIKLTRIREHSTQNFYNRFKLLASCVGQSFLTEHLGDFLPGPKKQAQRSFSSV